MPALFEPFFFKSTEFNHLFYDYVQREAITAFDLIAHPAQILQAYLRFLSEYCQTSNFLIDVKYNQMHLFDGQGRSSHQMPGLLKYFHQNRYIVVHLVRKNLFAQFVSTVVMTATKVGIMKNDDAHPEVAPFAVDLSKCRQNLQQTHFYVQQFRNWNRNNNLYRELCFEELFEDGVVTTEAAEQLGAIFGISIGERQPQYVKFNYDYRSLITNREALIQTFKTTPFKQMVLDIVG